MATQKYRNSSGSTLNGAITNVATSCTVTTPSQFPTAGDFPIIIENEICKVTNVVGPVFTIVRAQEGTIAAAHANGVIVGHVLTAGALDAMRAETIQQGTLAALPAAERVGRLYRPSDAVYDYFDTGSAWEPSLRASKVAVAFPSFTWVNQGTATLSTVNGGEFIRMPGGIAGDNIRARMSPIPAAPYTRIARIIPMLPPGSTPPNPVSYQLCGLAIYDGTKFITFGVQWRADAGGSYNYRGNFASIARWNSATSWNSDPYNSTGTYGSPISLRISDDNVNRRFSISQDGFDFITVVTESRTSFLTPTQIGYFVNSVGCSNDIGMRLVSWE